jgi:hypothetical protein
MLGAPDRNRTCNLLIRRSVTRWPCMSRPASLGLHNGRCGIRGAWRRRLIDRLNDSPSTVDSPQWTVTGPETQRSAGRPTWPPEAATLITDGDGAPGISRAGTVVIAQDQDQLGCADESFWNAPDLVRLNHRRKAFRGRVVRDTLVLCRAAAARHWDPRTLPDHQSNGDDAARTRAGWQR